MMKSDSISSEIHQRIDSELLLGEDLLWAARPGRRALLSVGGLSMISTVVMGLLMLGVFFTVFSSFRGASVFTALSKHGPGTIYTITDRRVLMLSGRSVRSYGPNDIELVERRMHGERGDVIFRYETRIRRSQNRTRSYEEPVGFFDIEHPREVEALMLETFRGAGTDDPFFDKPKHS